MRNFGFDKYDIAKEIKKSLSALGYKNPTRVQQMSIPKILKGKDIVVKSQTGSGKTAAFAIPICEKVKWDHRRPQALVLCPTRELAVQIKEDVSHIGKYKKIKCVMMVGRLPIERQINELKQRVHVAVGTPGRTFDHIERGSLILDEIKYLVIDEADEMLNMGFIDQVESIIKKLPKKRVTLLFSATMPDEIKSICEKYMNEPELIEVDSADVSKPKIEQAYIEVDEDGKFDAMHRILLAKRVQSSIVFCNTRDKVEDIYDRMDSKGYFCGKIHGGMEQLERLEIMKRFKRGEYSHLVATDVAARGIHVEDIDYVFNYDLPNDRETYVHRIGRTGRAGQLGNAISLVDSYEYEDFKDINEYVENAIVEYEMPDDREVRDGKRIMDKNKNRQPKLKKDKSYDLNKSIMRIRLNSGKKKKIRAMDILGTVTAIDGISGDDVGIIEIQDTCSYVEILNNKGNSVLKELPKMTLKGRNINARRVRTS